MSKMLIKNGAKTRERLIESAGKLFAQKGFHATTVRDICAKAGTNISAVKYYFQDKQTLYEETVFHAFAYADRVNPICLEGLDLNQQLKKYINLKLKGFLDPDRPHWHFNLIHGAGHNFSFKLDARIGEMIGQRVARLRRIVAALTGLKQEDEQVLFFSASITGQILFFAGAGRRGKNRPMSGYADIKYLDKITEHIYRFSLCGMGLEAETKGGNGV